MLIENGRLDDSRPVIPYPAVQTVSGSEQTVPFLQGVSGSGRCSKICISPSGSAPEGDCAALVVRQVATAQEPSHPPRLEDHRSFPDQITTHVQAHLLAEQDTINSAGVSPSAGPFANSAAEKHIALVSPGIPSKRDVCTLFMRRRRAGKWPMTTGRPIHGLADSTRVRDRQ